jgi:uncharacterized membrane protein
MSSESNATTTEWKVCPACQGQNPLDAIFCGNHACHKALGEFAYVAEEFEAGSNWIERLADRVAGWVGHPHFLTLHLGWFLLWVALNGAIIGQGFVFDPYPFGLLGIILAIEAVLITSMLLISSHRQNLFESKRAELEYEANISSYRLLLKLAGEVETLQRIVAGKQDAPS